MSFFSWLAEKMGGGKIPLTGDVYADIEEYVGEIYVREVAFWSTINIIANAVSKCEFKTIVKGKEVKGREYYIWNIEPNVNQNSSQFIHQWITKLYSDNECLIIEHNGQLLIADSFQKKSYALLEDVFTGVTVKGFSFSKAFKQSEVLYFNLGEKDMKKVVNALYESYAKLITLSMTAYRKSRATKGIFNYESIPITGKEKEMFDSLIDEKLKKFIGAENAVLPLGKGQGYTDVGSKTYSSESTRDIRSLIDDISDFTAKAFGVPPALLHGDVQGVKEVIDQLLTFCIDPLCDMLQEEITRKRIGLLDYLAGTKTIIDTKALKHIELLSVAASIDKLVSSGCFTINDLRKATGEEPIDEPWANQHFMTKNYATVEELLKNLGGEKNEKDDMGT